MEIKSAKGFVGFLATFLAAGAGYLMIMRRLIERVIRWRNDERTRLQDSGEGVWGVLA